MEHIPDSTAVLDVGCGSDFYLLHGIRDRIKCGIGIDMAVVPGNAGNITTVRTELFDRLDFTDASFDVVTIIAFMEHLDHPQAMLKECHRVLRSGGIIVLTTPMGRAKPFWELLVKLGFTEEKTTDDHKRYFTPAAIESMLTEIGFRMELAETFELGLNYLAVAKKT